MKKKDLKNGAVVVLENDEMYLKVDQTLLLISTDKNKLGTFIPLDYFDDDLNYINNNKMLNIVKVNNKQIDNSLYCNRPLIASFVYDTWDWKRIRKKTIDSWTHTYLEQISKNGWTHIYKQKKGKNIKIFLSKIENEIAARCESGILLEIDLPSNKDVEISYILQNYHLC